MVCAILESYQQPSSNIQHPYKKYCCFILLSILFFSYYSSYCFLLNFFIFFLLILILLFIFSYCDSQEACKWRPRPALQKNSQNKFNLLVLNRINTLIIESCCYLSPFYSSNLIESSFCQIL